MRRYATVSEAETARIGRDLAGRIGPGAVVLLFGELGVGKTVFVRGMAEGLGLDPAAVTSPTFTLVQEYLGHVPLYHVDLYRVESREVDDLGLDELGEGRAVVVIEWADRLPRPLDGAVAVRITDGGADRRDIAIEL